MFFIPNNNGEAYMYNTDEKNFEYWTMFRKSHLSCILCSLFIASFHLFLGDLKRVNNKKVNVKKPSTIVLLPHDFPNMKANVKVATTENSIIFGNTVKKILTKVEAIAVTCDQISKKQAELSGQMEEVLLRWSEGEPKNTALHFQSLPEGIQLPITTEEELIALNSRLEDKKVSADMVRFLHMAVWGKTLRSYMQNTLRKVLHKDIAIKYSRYGRKGKKNFSKMGNCLNMFLAVAAMKYPDASREDIGDALGRSLATAGDWDGRATRPSDFDVPEENEILP